MTHIQDQDDKKLNQLTDKQQRHMDATGKDFYNPKNRYPLKSPTSLLGRNSSKKVLIGSRNVLV